MKLTRTQQTLSNGTNIDLYQMENSNGYRLQAMTLGASITEFWMPDKQGKSENILLSAPTLDAYEHTRLYYGSIVGPVAGRIEDGAFSLQGKKRTLEKISLCINNAILSNLTNPCHNVLLRKVKKKKRLIIILPLSFNLNDKCIPSKLLQK